MAMSSTDALPAKIGVEIELLAPAGSNRKQLAKTIAKAVDGTVEAFFHLDSEPSKVKDKPVFYHLTQAFSVLNTNGKALVHCVDDITLQDTLEKSALPQNGWYRILSDDVRLLRLVMQNAKADAPIETALTNVAVLFGSTAEATQGGVYRVCDTSGASIALAAPLPGERERPCELVTTPLAIDDNDIVYQLLDSAKQLNFIVPNEGATHLHFDGAFFSSPRMFVKLCRFLNQYRLLLRKLLNTNLNCRKLGDWPKDFIDLIQSDVLLSLSWDECRQKVANTKINKYCDFNIRNLIYDIPDKHTLEIRMLPASLEAADIYHARDLFLAIFATLYRSESIAFVHSVTPSTENIQTFQDSLNL